MLLAIDTSTRWIGLALYDGSQVVGEHSWKSQNHHTVELATSISDLMKRCGVSSPELSALGCAIGPGSFTSLRIGLALAKGMAYALRLPIIGIPTLDIVVSAQIPQELPILVVLSAGRDRLAACKYLFGDNQWHAVGAPGIFTLDELYREIRTPTIVTGEMDYKVRQALGRKWKNVRLTPPALSVRRPAILAELAWERWQKGQTDNPATLVPIYIRARDPIPEV
jgi:tRNA threonylcarbamoyladenosine biosynthesis protein TsaB